jgi:hypothetical protein
MGLPYGEGRRDPFVEYPPEPSHDGIDIVRPTNSLNGESERMGVERPTAQQVPMIHRIDQHRNLDEITTR